jgi:predicted nucleic acid-binding protein
VAAISRVELIRGVRERERARTVVLLNSLRTFGPDGETAARVGELLREWRTLGVGDALIVASALGVGATLVTLNARDLPMPELRVLAVDEDAQARPLIR